MSLEGFLNKLRTRNAVWWRRDGSDGYGNMKFDDPVEVACRWDDINEMYLNEDGESKVSKSIVIVDRAMTIGDYLMLGDLDSTVLDNPLEETGAQEIKSFSATPDIRDTAMYYEAVL
jgi:hypothetical protein